MERARQKKEQARACFASARELFAGAREDMEDAMNSVKGAKEIMTANIEEAKRKMKSRKETTAAEIAVIDQMCATAMAEFEKKEQIILDQQEEMTAALAKLDEELANSEKDLEGINQGIADLDKNIKEREDERVKSVETLISNMESLDATDDAYEHNCNSSDREKALKIALVDINMDLVKTMVPMTPEKLTQAEDAVAALKTRVGLVDETSVAGPFRIPKDP